MSPFKSFALGAAAISLALAGTAEAAQTRSAMALPARTAQPAKLKRLLAPQPAGMAAQLFGGSFVVPVVIVVAAGLGLYIATNGSSADSPGS